VSDFIHKSEHNPSKPEMGVETLPCAVCEAMCPDAVDGTLTAAEQSAFDRHVSTCAVCSAHLSEAHRGAAWMEMLKSHRPAPSNDLLAKILAQTTGVEAVQRAHVSEARHGAPGVAVGTGASSAIVTLPNGKLGIAANLLPGAGSAARRPGPKPASWMYAGMQPRLAMTAAMAFFSLALTLNMLGVRLGDLHPDSLRRTANDARTSVVRRFENNRMVYQVESRVSDPHEGGPGQ
jgi:hypothetical protein